MLDVELPHVEGPIKRYLIDLYVGRLKSARKSGNPAHLDATDGIYFTSELQTYPLKAFWAAKTEEAFMNVIEALEGNYKAAEALWQNYEKKLNNFRATVKNDIISLEAGARNATAATARIKEAHDKTVAILNSPEMTTAIANAERLADALARIANLKSHKLTFAVLDNTPSPANQKE